VKQIAEESDLTVSTVSAVTTLLQNCQISFSQQKKENSIHNHDNDEFNSLF
jgi:hypothetical protein